MEIEITTQDREAEFDLFETTAIDEDTRTQLAPGVEARYDGTSLRKALDFGNVISIGVVIGEAAVGQLVANGIWDLLTRLKKRPERVEIDRVEVEFEENSVKKVVIERLRRP